MYKCYTELEDYLLSAANEGGEIFGIVREFIETNTPQGMNYSLVKSPIWYFTWLRSSPIPAEVDVVETRHSGDLLHIRTYGGMLNAKITEWIRAQCEQLSYAKNYGSLDEWLDADDMDDDGTVSDEISANVEVYDLVNGRHSYLETALMALIDKRFELSMLEVKTLLHFDDISIENLVWTRYSGQSESYFGLQSKIRFSDFLPV